MAIYNEFDAARQRTASLLRGMKKTRSANKIEQRFFLDEEEDVYLRLGTMVHELEDTVKEVPWPPFTLISDDEENKEFHWLCMACGAQSPIFPLGAFGLAIQKIRHDKGCVVERFERTHDTLAA